MKRFSIFCFFFICLISGSLAQETLPEFYKNYTQKHEGQKVTEGFYLIQNKNLSALPKNSSIHITRKLAADFSIFYTRGFSVSDNQSNFLYRMNGSWNHSISLKNALQNNRFTSKRIKVTARTLAPETFESSLFLILPNADVIYKYKNNFVIELAAENLLKLNQGLKISFLDLFQKPTTETPVRGNNISVNRINAVQSLYPEFNGTGMNVSVKELLFDTSDIDLRNRFFFIGLEAAQLDQHASAMATVIGGAGNTSLKGKGVANAVQITSSSFLNLLPDADENFTENSISVQNHSYGTTVENEYGIEAAAYDLQMNASPQILHIFSSGNQGTTTPESGPYAGIEGYANQTGNFKMAKNIITVGAISDNGEIDARSSKGPAFDGRVKPELVSFAPGGTSDASALVSGTAVVLQQFYKQQNNNALPNSSLIKAVLIAGAEDVGPQAIDYQSGYGSMNALQSIRVLEDENYFEGTIFSNETNTFQITIPENTKKIRIAITWNDEAANPGDAIALVNDLDMELMAPDSEIILPWILNPLPNIDAITMPAVRGKDHLNNNEFISLQNPAAGTYTLQINGTSVLPSGQNYSIAYFIEEQDVFEWTFPVATDAVENNTTTFVRWNNSYAQENGQLEINFNGEGWQILEASVGLEREAFEIDFSEFTGKAQLRMRIGNETFTSAEFGISQEILADVLYNCDDEIALGWPEVSNATAYQINNLSDRYMEVLTTVSDTTVVLPKSTFSNPFFSVTPLFETVKGTQGLAFDYELQFVNCYFLNFFAFLAEENTVNATLNLSTDINVESVAFQKTREGVTTTLNTFEAPFNDFNLTIEDMDPESGINTYTATITLTDETVITTDFVDIFIPSNKTLIVFPNPYNNNGPLNIVSAGSNRDLEIIDISGRVIYKQEVSFIEERLNVNLLPGLYFVRLLQNGKTLVTKKLLVN